MKSEVESSDIDFWIDVSKKWIKKSNKEDMKVPEHKVDVSLFKTMKNDIL